ncbi:MAG: UDP-N-acetylmuramoyl-L-alanyl-D-glutamate--2,6-diaminopimelate ligase [bacterium]
MLIEKLIDGLPVFALANKNSPEITGISIDTRQLQEGELFIALPGYDSDGHEFLKQAVKAGAAALLIEKDKKEKLPSDNQLPVYDCECTRKILIQLLQRFYGNPSEELCLIGITGTNGKTTTTHLLETIFSTAGEKTGLIGTIARRFDGRSWKADRTTPSVVENYRCLHDWADSGCRVAVMEVSSHGLEQGRVKGLSFAVSGFTNLSREHLDYHDDMEDYYRAKKKLFLQSDKNVICTEDEYGRRLAGELDALSVGKNGDYRVEDIRSDLNGTDFKLVNPEGVELFLESPLTGLFNYKNIALAAAIAWEAGVEPEMVSRGIAACPGIRGRCEKVLAEPAVLVDYAHTADAMENIIGSIKPLVDGKLIVVFGAGGDRDRGKRPEMGAVAARLADYSVITSDNPRSEDPLRIIDDILVGMEGNNHLVEPDRGQAIRRAIARASRNDTVLILGKGHETEQVVGERVIPFDDASVAREVAESLG